MLTPGKRVSGFCKIAVVCIFLISDVPLCWQIHFQCQDPLRGSVPVASNCLPDETKNDCLQVSHSGFLNLLHVNLHLLEETLCWEWEGVWGHSAPSLPNVVFRTFSLLDNVAIPPSCPSGLLTQLNMFNFITMEVFGEDIKEKVCHLTCKMLFYRFSDNQINRMKWTLFCIILFLNEKKLDIILGNKRVKQLYLNCILFCVLLYYHFPRKVLEI